jgi:hypothetical protein
MSSPPTPQGLTEIWRNPGLRPIGQPYSIGSVAVGIVTGADHTLWVVGVDPVHGAKLWQQPLTPSGITRGVAVSIAKVGDDKVAYLRPTSRPYAAELVVADARSGIDLVKSPEGVFSSPAFLCLNGRDVCTGWAPDVSARRRQYRLVVATGEYLPDRGNVPPHTRALTSDGLLDLGDRPGNTLGLLRDGVLRWATPIRLAFPAGFSSDNGWAWELFADQHVYTGSVLGAFTKMGAELVRDLASASATAGLSEDDGEVLWRDSGSTLYCPLGFGLEKKQYPLRCRAHGTATFHRDDRVTFEGLDVTVEGFDVLTGATTWSVRVGAVEGLAGGSDVPAIAGSTEVALQGPEGPMVLDYAAGRATTPPPDATFWCMTFAEYEFWQSYKRRDGTTDTRRQGGLLATICDSKGRTATRLPSIAATTAVGAQIGDYAVLATPSGYVGFKQR